MNRITLLITDILFAISLILTMVGTSGFTNNLLEFWGLLVIALATSGVMHFNYYKLINKIY